MKPEQIDQLRELLDKATPGPWDAVAAGQADDLNEVVAENGYKSIADAEGHDAALIAASRNALPDLLDALEKAEAEKDLEVAVAKGAVAEYRQHAQIWAQNAGAAEAALANKDAEIARLRDALTGIKRAATARRGGWSGEDHEYYFHTSSAALEDTP